MNINHELGVLLLSCFNFSSFFIRLASLVMIPQRHSPATAAAWLLVILLWPWPGILAYAAIGSNVLPAKRLASHQAMLLHLRDMRTRMQRKELPGTAKPPLPHALEATANLAEHLGYMSATRGNSVKFITSASDFIDTVVDEIDRAVSEVSMLYYIFHDDMQGRKVINAMRRAALRGVTVRLLVDSVGSDEFLKSAVKIDMENDGVQIAEALAVHLFRSKAARFDLRNHRKLALIDRRTALTGSHNITEATYGRRDLVWKDVSLKLEGPVVRQLESVFIEDWHVETGKMLDTEHLFEPENISSGGACLQTVPSGPSYQTENYQRLIIASIIGAQEQVTITTPYLIPDVGMMQAIEVARLRGVKVRLVVPEKSDQFIVGYAARAYYEDLLKLGVDIYLYGEGLLHAKTITVDNDLGFVGSSNFDIRSFSLNFEINMIFYGIGETYRIHTIQGEYICQSRRLTMQQWQERSHISMALESVTKLLSPLL